MDFDLPLPPDPVQEYVETAAQSEAVRRSDTRLNRLLALVVVFLVGHNLWLMHGARAKTVSKATSSQLEALVQTKTAYVLMLSSPSPAVASPALSPVPPVRRSPATRHNVSSPRSRPQDGAVARWRDIAAAHPESAGTWRRLGITQLVFHKAGSLDSFQRAVAAARAASKAPKTATKNSGSDTKPLLPFEQENALWQTLSSGKPITAASLADLRANLAKLHLGWFENLAAERLYTQAGKSAAAHQAQQAALASANTVLALGGMRLAVIVMGVLGLLGLLFRFMLRSNQPARSPATWAADPFLAPGYAPNVPALSDRVVPIGNEPVLTASRGVFGFSGRVGSAVSSLVVSPLNRKTAFVVYLALMAFIGFPLQLLRYLVSGFSAEALARINIALNLGIYIPLALIPLWLLRWLGRHASHSEPLSIRRILADLGFRTRSVTGDVCAGIAGYILIMPLFLVAALISNELFARFQTPVNPVETVMATLHTPLDAFLLFLETAVAAPLIEETMFRGLLYPALRARMGVPGAVALSAALFAIVHPTLPGEFLPIWTLGVALALVYEWRGSLLPGIILHGINNGLVLATVLAIFAP